MRASSVFPVPPRRSRIDCRRVVFGDPSLRADGDLLALAFAPDGTLWSLEEPGVLRQWSATTGQHLRCHTLSDLETIWCFSPGARFLASASDELSLWDVATGSLLASIALPSWVTALTFSKDCSVLATGHDDGAVRCWSLHSRHLIAEHRLHKRAIGALALSPDGAQLASVGEDKLIHLWNLRNGQPAGTFSGHADRVPALAWHPATLRLVSAGWDGTARVWHPETAQPAILLNGHAAQVNALAFNTDGSLLASADSTDAVYLWSFGDFTVRHILESEARDIRCLAFDAPGTLLAAGGGDRTIHLWNPQTGEPFLNGALGRSRSGLAVSPDGTRLVTVGDSQNLRLWPAGQVTPRESGTLDQAGLANTVAYSPDGRWVASGGDDALVRLWDIHAGSDPRILEGPEDPVTSLAFSPNSQMLASASSTGSAVWLWSTALADPVLVIPDASDGCTVEGLAFHPAGRLLAAGGIDWLSTGGSDGAACLWDIVERCEVATFPGGITALAIHPSGNWLATASLVNTVCIWDVATQALLAELAGPEDRINGVAFSPDGRWLAAGGDDRTIRLWKLSEGQPGLDPELEVALETQIKALCFGADSISVFTANGNTTCSRLDIAELAEDWGR